MQGNSLLLHINTIERCDNIGVKWCRFYFNSHKFLVYKVIQEEREKVRVQWIDENIKPRWTTDTVDGAKGIVNSSDTKIVRGDISKW